MKCCNVGCEGESGAHWACDSCCSIDMREPEPDVIPCRCCGGQMYDTGCCYCSELCEVLDYNKESGVITLSDINVMMDRILWNSAHPDELPF